MKTHLGVLEFLLFLFATNSALAGDPNFFSLNTTKYSFSRTVTIDSTKVGGSTLTNYPMLFSGTYTYLKTVANGGQVKNANGYDIIFTSDAAGNTKLDHEIETYSATTGVVNFWVRIPSVSSVSNTVIYLWYGRSEISSTQENATGVWDSNYKAVYHLDDGTTLNVNSSTGTNNGTNNGGTAATGKIDGAVNVASASSQYIASGTDANLYTAGNWSIELWCKPASTGFNGHIFGDYTAAGTVSSADLRVNSSNHFETFWENPNGTFPFATSAASTVAGTWYHVVGTWDGTTRRTYVNGGADGTNATGQARANPNASFAIGRTGSGSFQYFNGVIDEVRYSWTNRSAGWITGSYNNQNSPSTFYTIGSEITNASN